MKRHIPNILTIARVVLAFVCFGALSMLTASSHGVFVGVGPGPLLMTALVCFVVAAITDFFDGYLARKWKVTGEFGAILDPIADKILVTGAILGLIGMMSLFFTLASGLILFREFSVSAMREVLAPKGIKLAVTFLAKIKTTMQLLALAGLIFCALWQLDAGDNATVLYTAMGMQIFYIITALVTVWTGIEYAMAARKALKAQAV